MHLGIRAELVRIDDGFLAHIAAGNEQYVRYRTVNIKMSRTYFMDMGIREYNYVICLRDMGLK
jgi:hypothetical protein